MIYFQRSRIRKGSPTDRIENFCLDSKSNRYLRLLAKESNGCCNFYLDPYSGVDLSTHTFSSTEYFYIREWEF